MAVIGVGIDVVDIARFEESLERTPGLRERLFTPAEAARRPASLAARFAAKEALAKALGAPADWRWHDAEVVSEDVRPAASFEHARHRRSPAPRRSASATSTCRSPTTPASRRRSWSSSRDSAAWCSIALNALVAAAPLTTSRMCTPSAAVAAALLAARPASARRAPDDGAPAAAEASLPARSCSQCSTSMWNAPSISG